MPRVRNVETDRVWDVPSGHFSLSDPLYVVLAESVEPKPEPVVEAPAPEPTLEKPKRAPRGRARKG